MDTVDVSATATETPVGKTVANDVAHSPDKKKGVAGQNNATNGVSDKPSVGAVEVQRGTVVQPGDVSQIEHVVIKKKPKCKCCVIQ